MTTPQPEPPAYPQPYPPAQESPYPPARPPTYPPMQAPAFPPVPVYPSVQVPAFPQPYSPGYPAAYPQPLVQVQRVDRNGIGTAGLVLGIVAVAFSVIPVIGIISWGIWPVGAVLAWVGLTRADHGEATNRTSAVAGLVLAAAAALICLAWVLGPMVYFATYSATH